MSIHATVAWTILTAPQSPSKDSGPTISSHFSPSTARTKGSAAAARRTAIGQPTTATVRSTVKKVSRQVFAPLIHASEARERDLCDGLDDCVARELAEPISERVGTERPRSADAADDRVVQVLLDERESALEDMEPDPVPSMFARHAELEARADEERAACEQCSRVDHRARDWPATMLQTPPPSKATLTETMAATAA